MNHIESQHQDGSYEFSFDKWKFLTLSSTKDKVNTILDIEKENIAKEVDPNQTLERDFASLDEKGEFHDINDQKNADEIIARTTKEITAHFGANNLQSFSEELLT